ncbi:uncharacterized protein [Gossypium hirsutum]|uniref:G-patch domain-containing protein n=1 Tax=Gossypium hirsutum TaxID=3635 RepID=A0A1U8L2E6_GOSHI|nr:uncharacterized protein LOC107921858 [Gossypium hirsutum]
MAEMAQLLRATDKGKAPMAITKEDNKGPPPGFTPPHVPLQTEAPPRRPSVTYNHVTDMSPDKITPQNMEKKPNESFRQCAQRRREVAMQVQPPLLEKETTMLFINTLKEPFITHMIGSTTKRFVDIVMAGEMIENAVRGGKIEGEAAKRSAPRRKDNEVNNMNSLNSRAITVGQPKAAAVKQQSTRRQESGTRQNSERMQFTPIPVTYRELYESLYNAHAIAPFHLKPLQPPYPKWYDANAKCEYHEGIPGHSIENCTGFKKVVERLIKIGVVKFDSTLNTKNLLPDHGNQGVNAIDETREEKIKEDIAEVKTPIKVIWGEMVKRGMLTFGKGRRGIENYCEFHGEEGHMIQICEEFKAMRSSYKRQISVLENERQGTNQPRIIISLPGNNEVGVQTGPRVVIHKPNPFLYKDGKRVLWSYDCSVTVPEGESIASGFRGVQNEGFHTRSGNHYNIRGVGVEPTKTKGVDVEKEKEAEVLINEPMKEEEAKGFLKFLKHSGYSVVLNETYVTHDISVNKLDRLVNNISVENFIYFNDDEIPPGGIGSTKALHIITRCKGYTLPSVLIDNGSALNQQSLARPLTSRQMKRLLSVFFRSLEIINATFILEGSEVSVPKMSRATRMALQMMMGKGALPGKGLGRRFQGGIQIPKLIEKKDRFGLGFKPGHKHKRQEIERRQVRRRRV